MRQRLFDYFFEKNISRLRCLLAQKVLMALYGGFQATWPLAAPVRLLPPPFLPLPATMPSPGPPAGLSERMARFPHLSREVSMTREW